MTFRGGIHPPEAKQATSQLPLKPLQPPEVVYILLQQHIGAPCSPLVQEGDTVLMGQKVGDSDAFISAPVHASVSGTVRGIEGVRDHLGRTTPAVVIENDGQDQGVAPEAPGGELHALQREQIRELVREAGIVGMGGAAFPTHVKLSPPPDCILDTIILNGCECEPYLTCDHRLMLEHPAEIVDGLQILMRGCDVQRAIIAVEDNKLDALRALQEVVGTDPTIAVVSVQTKYPQGAEKQLIQAVAEREVPSGQLPLNVGIVVQNVGTARAVSHAVRQGLALVERPLTVAGAAVAEPANLVVRVGTPISEVIAACGGTTADLQKLVLGGPMMGVAQFDQSIPVVKGMSGILCLGSAETGSWPESACIRCGQCLTACPVGLMPLYLGDFPHEHALEYRPLDCIECGSCTYVCPARRYLIHNIRLAKAEATARARQRQAGS